jgi:membrane-associated protein
VAHRFLDFFLHIDRNLALVIATYGFWTYLILFGIVFCETGLVVTPLLPGDSLLFAAGTFAALGSLRVELLIVLLTIAAVVGDTLNYYLGWWTGPRVFTEGSRWFRREHLERTHRFYDKYGAKTIILARFAPIVRTFAPFVAGIGRMSYRTFLAYNVVGGAAWIACFVFGGYWFGNVPLVRSHFTLVIMGIIFVSILPGLIEFARHSAGSASRST